MQLFFLNILRLTLVIPFCYCLLTNHSLEGAETPPPSLKDIYLYHCRTPSDIYQHLPVLRHLSSECSSATEIGIRSMVSTWAILQGLADSASPKREYVGIDIDSVPPDRLYSAIKLAKENNIQFEFIQANDMTIQIKPTDLLFIDSLHTYCHLTYELETFSPNVRKYICLHDTSAPWGEQDDVLYRGDYSEYPASYDKTKRGLWPAIQDFLQKHPEWTLLQRLTNNHGFTILKRKNQNTIGIDSNKS